MMNRDSEGLGKKGGVEAGIKKRLWCIGGLEGKDDRKTWGRILKNKPVAL